MLGIAPYIKPYFPDDDGQPLAGGLLYTYETGTTTPKTAYKYSGGTAHSNPIVLDSRGEIPDDAGLYLDSDIPYRFRLERADATEVWTRDGVTPETDAGVREDIATGAAGAVIFADTVAEMKALTGLVDGAKIEVTDTKQTYIVDLSDVTSTESLPYLAVGGSGIRFRLFSSESEKRVYNRRYQVAPNGTIISPDNERFIVQGVQMFSYLFVSFEARTDYTYRTILSPPR